MGTMPGDYLCVASSCKETIATHMSHLCSQDSVNPFLRALKLGALKLTVLFTFKCCAMSASTRMNTGGPFSDSA